VNEQVDAGWGKIESRIVFNKELAPALKGLTDFSHVMVIFWMHQAEKTSVWQRRPQGREDMPVIGLYAQRSKHRVNQIGVTVVPIIDLEGNVLTVRRLDAINGTPVLDIKPYCPIYDRPENVRTPPWFDRLMVDYF